MVKKLHGILRSIAAKRPEKTGGEIMRCKGGCGLNIEHRKDTDPEYAEYCDDCFGFIFARR